MESRIRKMAYTGLLTAISIILTRFFAANINILGVFALRLSFGEVPIMLSGILLGPVYGVACGALSDIIGYAINPVGGPYFPGFTLTAALTGLIPNLMARYYRNNWNWPSITVIVTVTTIITVLLNTLWLSWMFDKAYFALLPPRVIGRTILLPAHVIIIRIVLKHTQRVFHFL
ncbi:ECF transporter S component (folate family) [Caldicoprobacter guelmensis]|uniref:folate family ECF transporter S component n=1 Tax=Caldicoprobacter guelmensis TaxID=1170224 RepID=UPI00195D1B74|nr:folate family ECF transporter S component [Caldicoprobacter guelmensis]MBM7581636.1 ECF transporter S component (folate family) [Caldicoprobacter guelmensis]